MSSTRPERPVVTTRVGRALFGDNHFRGKSVARELVGRPMAALYGLAIGGPELSDAQARILDALIASALASDPRIWPLKVAPLVGSYGSTLAGFSAATGYFEGMMVSPMQAEAAAQVLEAVRAKEDAGEALEDALSTWGKHIPGFGIPARATDERVATFSTWYEAYTTPDERPHWELAHRIMAARPDLEPNITCAAAAAALDLGFDPHQAGLLLTSCAMMCAIATSSEASQARASSLKSLPSSSVDYVGPPPSTSPRTQTRATSHETS